MPSRRLIMATCHAHPRCRVVVVEAVVGGRYRAHGHALSCHCGIPVGPCHARPRRRVVVVVDGQF